MFINLQLFASKKGGSSSKNGRDSESKRLGLKKSDGQSVLAGNIIETLTSFTILFYLFYQKIDTNTYF